MLTVQVSLSLLLYVMLTAMAVGMQIAVLIKANLLALDIAVTIIFLLVGSFMTSAKQRLSRISSAHHRNADPGMLLLITMSFH